MRIFALLSAAVLVSSPVCGDTQHDSPVGRQIQDFELRDFRGTPHTLGGLAEQKLVVLAFMGTECPLAKLYAPRLAKLAREFEGQGVAFLGINSNRQDSITEIAHFARVHEVPFPILKDVGNDLADRCGAVRTPEVFLLDADRKVRYWGRIDDQYLVGLQRAEPTREDLKLAIGELLAGKPVSQPQTQSIGCLIGRVSDPQADADVTYSGQIAAVLNKRCVACHREGEIAPFALTNYEEVAGWAPMIAEVVREGRMPPWHADPKHGEFSNDGHLSQAEKDLIYRWVKQGAPQGDPQQTPATPEFVDGWQIPEPDEVFYIRDRPVTIPAEGEVKYQYYSVDPGFTEDKWIRAAECRPGNRSVVHHIIVFVQPPGARARGDGEWLAATAPGARPLDLQDGQAKFIPKGSKLVFQMHYTPNGSVQQDRSCVGLVFADPDSVKRIVRTDKASTHGFAIPPGADNHRVEASKTFHEDTLLLSFFPHMHLRGKAFRYVAHFPDGRDEILLDIPRYDFNWQNSYVLAEPKLLPRGTRMQCIAHFDNSEDNLANPDPSATVRWGDQTWDEMMIGYFDATPAELEPLPSSKSTRTDSFQAAAAAGKVKVDDALKKSAAAALSSPENFQRFGLALRETLPQLDRVCLTVVSDGKLRIEQAVQPAEIRRQVAGRGLAVRAKGLALTRYTQGDEMVVHQDLGQADGPDLELMRRALASSVHIPLEVDGKRASLNFWSRESGAFPAEAVKVIQEVFEQFKP